MSSDKFYLGRVYDAAQGQTTPDPLLYDPKDLTTHAVIVGMTGSGKTGLCLDLMEEAALQKVPALMIDLKGDITNALLHFPDLAVTDFAPWINVSEAQRAGKTTDEAAAETADLWRNGLAQWGVEPERIQQLKESAQFAIFTPGSDAGLPISILSSLTAPEIEWAGNEEILRERISSTVTAILGLIGFTGVDPIRSREHILLANIFEDAWSQKQDLDLAEIIMRVQTPPFEKLGVFDIKMFFPDKDRFELAMLLNNILAAPTFQSWISGTPLDIPKLLYMDDGRPRHTIFYLAHLNDAERMFFVTLLYGAVETWMRAQSGTGSLRALVYFDEIFGYLPPTANPPSKEPMLRLLKQARAFGVGMVLATQNPVDIDYKALSNAGTWFIGKLATERDKQRLLDGLESAMNDGGLDRSEYDRLISGLGKRVFLLRNVHDKRPQLFQTRWAMNYLAGPMTRTQIPALNELAGAIVRPTADSATPTTASAAAPQAAAPEATQAAGDSFETAFTAFGSVTKPAIPGRVTEYFLPHTLPLMAAMQQANRPLDANTAEQGMVYRPVLLAQGRARVNQRKYNTNVDITRVALVYDPDPRGVVNWDTILNLEAVPLDALHFDIEPHPAAVFAPLEPPFNDAKLITALRRDFKDWLYHATEITVKANEQLKIYAGPDIDEERFEQMCLDAAKEKALAEVDKVGGKFDRQIVSIEKKLKAEERELAEDEAELTQRRREEGFKHVENFVGFFTGRRRSLSTSMTKRRMTSKAKADVEESLEAIEDFKQELQRLEEEKKQALDERNFHWMDIADDTTEIAVKPYKKDITVELFGVAWLPYYLVEENGRTDSYPAFSLSAIG